MTTGSLLANITGNLSVSGMSEIVVTDGSMDLDVTGNTLIKQSSKNTATTGMGNSLELIFGGALTFDSGMLVVTYTDLTILSSGDLCVHSSTIV